MIDRIPTYEERVVKTCAESGEPCFVIRAQDILAIPAISEYLNFSERWGIADNEWMVRLMDKLTEFRIWQSANRDLLHFPD